jgi:hypothetical protein
MKKRYFFLLLLMVTAAFTAAGLGAQAFISETEKKPFFLWGGVQFGSFKGGSRSGIDMVALGCDLSAQFGPKVYASIYGLTGSEFLGDGPSIEEFGFMVGRCFRTRRTFTGMGAGLGFASGWIGGRRQGVGVPLKLEASLIIGSFVALNLQIHAFIWEESYLGMSLGLQFGKMH